MAFAPSRRKKHLDLSKEELNLNSMMDMMTIILLFLIKTFSTSGQIVTPSQDLKLPFSTSQEQPTKELSVAITRHAVLIGSDVIMELKDLPQQDNLIPPLYTRLTQLAKQAQEEEVRFGKIFNHEVIVQADEDTPFQTLVKVLYTCGQSEYNKLRLLTFQEGF
jgi:biopolymer transport protein ExbD